MANGLTTLIWVTIIVFATRTEWWWFAVALTSAAIQILSAAPKRFRPVVLGSRTAATSQVWLAAGTATIMTYVITIVARLNPPVVATVIAATLSGLVMAVAEELRIARNSVKVRRRAVVIGEGPQARHLVRLIEDHPETGIKLVGVIGDRDLAATQGLAGRWLAPMAEAMTVIDAEGIDLPIVAAPIGGLPRRLADQILDAGIDIAMSPGVDRVASGRLTATIISHETLPVIRPARQARGEIAIKRAGDIAVAAVVLVAAAPVLAVAAVAIKLTSTGPVLFRQTRIGRDGRPFSMVKLRTMVVDAEDRLADVIEANQRSGPLFKAADDPRITTVGRILRKFSVDELPQFLNVLRGDMSVIGPRPALEHEVEQFDSELVTRMRVLPGISGLWQVEARANSSFDAYRRLDLHYVENWSLLLDVRLVIATAHLLLLSPPLRGYTMRKWGVGVGTDPTVVIDLRDAVDGDSRISYVDGTSIDEARDLPA